MSEPQKQNITSLGSVRRKQIYNSINALHYQGIPLLVCVQHKSYDYCLYLKANPEPIYSENATARWIKDDSFPENLEAFNLVKVVLNSTNNSYEFSPECFHFEKHSCVFTVPENASEVTFRKQTRFRCIEKSIPITLTQNAIVFTGNLLDYSTSGILVTLQKQEGISFTWLNEKRNAQLSIQGESGPVYTGKVNLTPRESGQYLLTPNLDPVPRYAPREYRSRRQKLVPSPDLTFEHPVTGKQTTLKIHDLSGLGFSVEESFSRAALIPGLLIKEATISFANSLLIPCMAQVVYLKPDENNSKSIRVGIAILDIDVHEHLKLISLVQQAQDSQAYISNQINPSDLFDFFFETGFIYPNKYAEIAAKKEEIIHSYMSLYKKGVDISRHFVYQKTGQILGHFSALQVYKKTWFCQHHAALNSQRAGLRVVRAISEYINDSYQLNPTNIEYIIGYYQISNKFPKRYFGDFVDKIKDPKKTSLDCFSYVKEARKFSNAPASLAEGWTLEPAVKSDIVEFQGYYQKASGGLLIDALDMGPKHYSDRSLTEKYKANNLTRERELFALRYSGLTKAVIDVQSTDFGLNLSEITSAITVYVIDPSPINFDMVSFAIRKLSFQKDKMSDPVMLYPSNFLKDCGINADKEYTMWAFNVPQGIEYYMAWMNRFCR
jgi:hypothetical protein